MFINTKKTNQQIKVILTSTQTSGDEPLCFVAGRLFAVYMCESLRALLISMLLCCAL